MSYPRLIRGACIGLLTTAAAAGGGAAQAGPTDTTSAPADTVRLAQLLEAALAEDPRSVQPGLVEGQSEARLRTIAADRLPTIGLYARSQHQSVVPSIPFDLPGGFSPPVPPRDSYEAAVTVRQNLYDPSIAARRQVESARGEEARASVDASLYSIRDRVSEAFFMILLLEAQAEEVEAAIGAIQAHLHVIEARRREGAALPSEEAGLRRELLRREQARDQLRARAEAARDQLEQLAGVPIGTATHLEPPSLAALENAAPPEWKSLQARPEYGRFRQTAQLLERRAQALSARARPRLSAFGRAGYGRPGLNPLSTRAEEYWLAGVEVEWSPWQRGTIRSERGELALQKEILETEVEAFTRQLEQSVTAQRAEIEQLESALARDDRIVELSEQILGETRLRFEEGVVTSAELLEDEADLLRARLDRVAHSVGLAHARTRLLTIIGQPIP